MKFKRLKISDWRQFNEVSIDFHNKVTVITGSNGAGKSTVLRILAKHFSWNCDFWQCRFTMKIKGLMFSLINVKAIHILMPDIK